MAILQTVVRLSGGLVVAAFQYMADMDLYRLMVVDGSVQVVRDGELVMINQIDVVPGRKMQNASCIETFHTATTYSITYYSFKSTPFRRCC